MRIKLPNVDIQAVLTDSEISLPDCVNDNVHVQLSSIV